VHAIRNHVLRNVRGGLTVLVRYSPWQRERHITGTVPVRYSTVIIRQHACVYGIESRLLESTLSERFVLN
jgi:hypothetical protein